MDLDDAYANGAHIEGAAQYPPRWARQAQTFRDDLGPRAPLDLRYDAGPRHVFDLFEPEGVAKGTVVFVHGGYWRAFDKSFWSHLAAGCVAAGWTVAMPSYDLCPQVRIGQITRQIALAVVAIAAKTSGPIRLTGHSAGGHLVARMLAPGILPDDVAVRITGCVPISPLSDLVPIRQLEMNDDFCLSEAEAYRESPVNQPKPGVPVTVWVGAKERPAFICQAALLAMHWSCDIELAPGRHHFDVIDDLCSADSALTRLLTG